MKKLKEGYKGKRYYVKSLDKNIILEDNPKMIEWYDELGLDVLEEKPKKKKKKADEVEKAVKDLEEDDNTE